MMTPLCTILVSCYNKRRYVGQAIDSALSQSYPHIEVIAVDDGSRDGSPEVLAAFGHRIKTVFKENGGQASAMNIGFALSTGDIIFFLDGDDMLLPKTVERVVAAWRPNFSKVHFRLQKITEDGEPVPGAFLPPYRDLPSGNLRDLLDAFGFYPSPPSSGNAYARSYLQVIMPLAEIIYRHAADTPVIGMAPLFGEIGALDDVGGFWRISTDNISSGDLTYIESTIAICENFIIQASAYAFGINSPKRLPARWPYYLKRKIILAKFDKARPRRPKMLTDIVAYLHCVIRWPEYNAVTRLKFGLWAVAIAVVPAKLLRTIPGVAGRNLKLGRATKPR